MAKPRTVGNLIAPPRFLAFLAALIVGFPIFVRLFHRWALGAMTAFDAAAILFLVLCLRLLRTQEAAVIRLVVYDVRVAARDVASVRVPRVVQPPVRIDPENEIRIPVGEAPDLAAAAGVLLRQEREARRGRFP